MNWYSLLRDLGVFSIGGILITWLIQKFNIEYQIKFSKLHNERAEAIKALYLAIKCLNDEINNFKNFLMGILNKNKEPKETLIKAEKLAKCFDKLYDVYYVNKMYFTINICEIIDYLHLYYGKNLINLSEIGKKIHESPDNFKNEAESLKEKLQSIDKSIFRELDSSLLKELRILLGVKRRINMSLNFIQKMVLILFMVGIFYIGIVNLPWINKADNKFLGYGPIYTPPMAIIRPINSYKLTLTYEQWLQLMSKQTIVKCTPVIDAVRLIIEFAVLLSIIGILLIITIDKRKKYDFSKSAEKKSSKTERERVCSENIQDNNKS
jgi:hypothetical protein